MSSRLAFQTQLASIMEVLANAAVAEICKLVDDDYAVVSLQMSQCQRENKALKRKLHLLELKMARGNAERRLRESILSSRPRVQINANTRTREPSPTAGKMRGVRGRQIFQAGQIPFLNSYISTTMINKANISGTVRVPTPSQFWLIIHIAWGHHTSRRRYDEIS